MNLWREQKQSQHQQDPHCTGPSNTELGCWAGSCLGNHQLRLKAIKIIQFQVSFSVPFQFVTNKMTNKTKSGGKKICIHGCRLWRLETPKFIMMACPDVTSLVPACTITVWTEGWTSKRAGVSSIKSVALPPDGQYVTAPGSLTNLRTKSPTI